MRLLLILLLPFLVAATNAPMSRPVWVVATNVIGRANGTQKYPFDGSTPARFDSLHRGFPPYTTINLFSNQVYLTTGSASYNDANGWWVRPGWKVRGHGATVKQIFFPDAPVTHGVYEMRMEESGPLEISDLVIDENWKGNPEGKSFAISVWGSNCKISQVTARHGYGNRETLAESFSISVSSYPGQISTNGLIDRCVVEDYLGNYGIAIALMPGVRGKVSNCAVTNFVGTAPFGLSAGVVYENNVSVGCFGGYYTDTGSMTNVIIRDCRMLASHGFGIHINPVFNDPYMGAALAMNLVIEGCEIETDGIGIAFSGPLGPGYQYNFTVQGTTFTGVGSPIVAAHVQGLTVTDNLVKDGAAISLLNWPEYPSFNIVSKRNYRLPASDGLEDQQP